MLFCGPYAPADDALRAEVLDDAARVLLDDFLRRADALPDWTEAELDGLLKAVLKDHGVKMPKLAIPLRVAVTGHKHTPSIGAVLALLGRETVLRRLAASLA
jgi:glutamyl-tRNA synthetase